MYMFIKRGIKGGLLIGFFLCAVDLYMILIQKPDVFQGFVEGSSWLQALYSLVIWLSVGTVFGCVIETVIWTIPLLAKSLAGIDKYRRYCYSTGFLLVTLLNLRFPWFEIFRGLSIFMQIASFLYIILLTVALWLLIDRWGYAESNGVVGKGVHAKRRKGQRSIKITGKSLLVVAFIMGILFLLSQRERGYSEIGGSVKRSKPSVIVIVIDTLRADYLSCYGRSNIKNDTIDSLANNSILFENAFTHAAWTKPAIATLFTSLYPTSHRVNVGTRIKGDSRRILSEDALTMAEYFKGKGYYTEGINTNATITKEFGYGQGFDQYVFLDKPLLTKSSIFYWIGKLIDVYPRDTFYVNAKSLVDHTLKWLDRNKYQPFFLYLHFMDPHRPYMKKPDAFWLETDSDYEKRMYPSAKASYLRHYKREIAFVDFHLSRLIEQLKRSGIYDESLVLLTADHGEEFLEHGGWDHGHSLYNELLRIPLLIKPPLAKESMKDDRLIGLIDVFPTVVSMLGLEPPQGLQGKSMLDDKENAINDNQFVFFERGPTGKCQQGLCEQGWKIILTQDPEDASYEKCELFNIIDDSTEQFNLSEEFEDIAGRLKNKTKVVVEFALANAIGTKEVTLDSSMKERLKGLGYLK